MNLMLDNGWSISRTTVTHRTQQPKTQFTGKIGNNHTLGRRVDCIHELGVALLRYANPGKRTNELLQFAVGDCSLASGVILH